jgi:hypothetical protein
MDGPEFSVDAIVYHGEIIICGLADRHIFFPPYFIEMGHTIPTNIETEKQEVLLETFRAGIRSLGLAGDGSIGAAKGDVKLTPSGPMLGEIAARLSGGYMSGWTYPFASGVEPVRAAILAAMGQRPDNLAPQKNWTSAERAFISIPGTVKSIAGIEEAKTAPHIREFFLRAGPGEAVNFPENNVSKCGNLISAAPSRAEAVEAASRAARSILIRLDPEDSRTGAFLSSTGVFPPDAFNLSPGLRSALSGLPETVFPETGGAPSAPAFTVYYRPFPEFMSAALQDYMGRTVAETLEAVRRLTALSLPEAPETTDNKGTSENNRFLEVPSIILGKSFWAALARGGYQGAAYYIDQLEMSGK